MPDPLGPVKPIVYPMPKVFNSSPPGQIIRHFADDNEKICILIKISLKCVS